MEERIVPAILNGNFAISDPASPAFGYILLGNANVTGGQGILNEGSTTQSEISQTFTIDPGVTKLVFTIAANNLTTNGAGVAPDAFEVALLDPATMRPLVGPPSGLANTDSFLNIQQTGQVFFAPGVTVPGASASGQVATLAFPLTVTVDVSSLTAGTRARISFDLVGLAPATSSVRVANLAEIDTSGSPPLTIRLDPASQTGPPGTDLTRISAVTIDGKTNPGQGVTLAAGGATFTATADGAGDFTVPGVPLSEGPNTIQVAATGPNGTTTRPVTATLDDLPPTGVLALPRPGSSVAAARGFVQEQYADPGVAGLDPSSIAPANIRIPGVVVTAATDLGGGLVRYDYAGTLSAGPVTVSRVAGSVRDLAGNGQAAGSDTFTIGPVLPTPPAALADSFATPFGTPLVVPTPGVLGNDIPGDAGPALTATLLTPPVHGTLEFRADGSFTYVPAPGFSGTDTFLYEADRGTSRSNGATVTIVTAPPVPPPAVAINDSYSTPAATPLVVAAPSGVLSNDSGSGLSASLVTPPAHGTLMLNADGSFTYVPAPAFSGTDSFVYDDLKGAFRSNNALVTLTIVPAPLSSPPPIAAGDSFSTTEGGTLAVPAPGVLANDTGAALGAALVQTTEHGTLTLRHDGSFVYAPDPSYSGDDHFSYRAVAGSASSAPAVVTIHVLLRPSPIADLPLPVRGLLGNYSREPAAVARRHPNLAPFLAAVISGVRPTSRFYQYLRDRRALDPARFDHYHPKLGPLLRVVMTLPPAPGATPAVSSHRSRHSPMALTGTRGA